MLFVMIKMAKNALNSSGFVFVNFPPFLLGSNQIFSYDYSYDYSLPT